MSDQELICRICGAHFMGTLGEDEFCSACMSDRFENADDGEILTGEFHAT